MSRRGPILTLVIALMLATVAPTALAQPPAGRGQPMPWVGERINILLSGETAEFPADTAFHVRHGWLWEPGGPYTPSQFAQLFDFRLEIDGVDQGDGAAHIERLRGGGAIYQSVFNFPAGLPAGTYDFVGRWIAPCDEHQDCVDEDQVEHTVAVEIEFVAPTPWVGEQINILLSGETAEFPADTAFHVRHGWLWEPGGPYTPEEFGELFDFRLEIGGVDQGDGLLVVQDAGGGKLLYLWVFNFPTGLAEASYQFEGLWIAADPVENYEKVVDVCFFSGASC